MEAMRVSVDAMGPPPPEEMEGAIERYQELAVFPSDSPDPDSAICALWHHRNHDMDESDADELLAGMVERALIHLVREEAGGLPWGVSCWPSPRWRSRSPT